MAVTVLATVWVAVTQAGVVSMHEQAVLTMLASDFVSTDNAVEHCALFIEAARVCDPVTVAIAANMVVVWKAVHTGVGTGYLDEQCLRAGAYVERNSKPL